MLKSSLFQVACVAIPKGLGGVLTVVLNGVLMTRLSPAEFGAYAVCLMLVALADGVFGAAIDMSAVKLAATRGAVMEQWALVVKLAISACALAVAAIVARPLAETLFHRPAADLLLVALAVASGVLFLRSIFLHLQLQQRFIAYAGLELLAQTLRVLGIAVTLLWFTASATSLTVAALCGTIVALAGGVLIARVRPHVPALHRADGREFVGTLRWIFTTFAFSAVLARIDVLLLTHGSTIEQVGLFAAAATFALIPELLGMYLSVVFSPKVTPARLDGTLGHLMKRVQGGLLVLAIAVACGSILVVQFGTAYLPPAYARSADVFWPLLAGGLAGMLALPMTVPLVMFVKPSFIFKYDLITLPFLLIAYHYAIAYSGAIGAAWVSGGSRIVKTCVLQTCAALWARTDPPLLAASS